MIQSKEQNGPPKRRIQTSFLQKGGLILFGIFVTLTCLEIGMRAAGRVILSRQERRNLQAIQKKGAYLIMCLGESTTQGEYPIFLEDALNANQVGVKFGVIDAGQAGTDTGVILADLEKNLDRYRPDMVVAMMGINDSDRFLETRLERDSFWKICLSSLKVYQLARFVVRHLESKLQGEEQAWALAIDRSYGHIPSEQQSVPSQEQIMKEDADLRKAVEAGPQNSRVFVEQGRKYMEKGEGAKAEQLLRQAIQLDAENSYAYDALSLLYEKESRIDEAEELLLHAPRQDELICLSLARVYWKLERYDKIEEVLRRAVRVSADRDLAWPHAELASLFLKQGRMQEAEEEAKMAVELNPRNNWALFRLAKIYSQKGRYQEAEELMDKAAAIKMPDQALVLYEQACMLASHGKMDAAVDVAERALVINPNEMSCRQFLYGYYRQQGDLVKAEEVLREAVKANPQTSLWALGELAVFHYEMNDMDYVRRFAADYWDGNKHPRKWTFYQPMTRRNFRKLKAVLDQRGIAFVVVQYPTRDVKPLRDLFAGEENIVFVDNKQIFRDAVMRHGFKTYFVDMFAGDFGHCTDKGNRLLAQNIARTILREVFYK